ncbi:MAG: ABC transporter ATP-binding protein [Oscillibacter sp.]|nr:ABC transporter ATP-binding protein [Oscillibacter sp.]
MAELLRMEHITKRFGNFYANRDISLTVNRGEVLTLLGENGAGKSTLMNILIGLYQPTEGKIFLEGREVRIESPGQAVALGIGMVHQHFMLVEAMTVFENIILGDRKARGLVIDRAARRTEIAALSEKYGLEADLDRPVTELSVGAKQRVEILKALYHGAELLILDEPTAVLTDMEAEGLFVIMRKLTGEGKSVVFISHKMREVLRVSDRITILRAGETAGTVARGEADGQRLANMMIGRELSRSQYEKKTFADSVSLDSDSVSDSGKADIGTGPDGGAAGGTGNPPAALRLTDVDYHKASRHSGLNGVTLAVRQGEIVGIAGVDGNGQTQLAQLAAGVIAPEAGSVELDREKVAVFDPAAFIAGGVAHVPEDRNAQGLVGDMSVSENLVLKDTDRPPFSRLNGLLLNKRAISDYGKSMAERYDIRCASLDQDARSLSGGNQQKIILARELESGPALLVAAHPTRGLDIGAARFVHDQMIAARDRGVGILLISADFDEILEMSDRILVLFEGRIMGEYPGIAPPVRAISLAMTGSQGDGGPDGGGGLDADTAQTGQNPEDSPNGTAPDADRKEEGPWKS